MSITITAPVINQVVNVQFGNEWDTRGFHFGRAKVTQIQERMFTVYLVEEIDADNKPTGLVGLATPTEKDGVDLVCTNARMIGAKTHGGEWTRERSLKCLGFEAA